MREQLPEVSYVIKRRRPKGLLREKWAFWRIFSIQYILADSYLSWNFRPTWWKSAMNHPANANFANFNLRTAKILTPKLKTGFNCELTSVIRHQQSKNYLSPVNKGKICRQLNPLSTSQSSISYIKLNIHNSPW